jgi:LPLT family lysophospholipid transporter-like MFS transporter
MHKALYLLLLAQFLSVFADNTILFTVIALVMQAAHHPDWYVPALQSVFLAAFVLMAPWVGPFADQHPKSRVLIIANLIKATGAGLMLLGVEPLFSYCIVGMGAAMYSPAKYGILPELVEHQALVKANSWIEGSTILAILTGMVAGGKVADYSTTLALSGAIVLFLCSAVTTLRLPVGVCRAAAQGWKPRVFAREIHIFLSHGRTRFAVLGGSLFWGAAACVRVIIIAWAPVVLMLHSAGDIAELTLFLALGIIAGSALAPALIPLEHLRRAQFPGYLMAVLIITLGFMESLWPARGVLFLLGAAGGLFIVPINAALQELGQKSIGAGGAVAMQNFFQNVAMLITVGSYTLAASQQLQPISALVWLGGLLLLAMLLLMHRLPGR